jgi:hypothetical protein
VNAMMTRIFSTTLAALVCVAAPTVASVGEVVKQQDVVECGAVTTRPASRDNDPIYKITLNLGQSADGLLVHLDVIHTAVSGAKHDRREQYRDFRLFQGDEVMAGWTGRSIRNPALVMGGIFFTKDQRTRTLVYEERLHRNKKLETVITSICHFQSEKGR